MDSFVFAVALKKNSVKLQKDYQDLVPFIILKSFLLKFMILSYLTEAEV